MLKRDVQNTGKVLVLGHRGAMHADPAGRTPSAQDAQWRVASVERRHGKRDHFGLPLKEVLRDHMRAQGYAVEDQRRGRDGETTTGLHWT
jgi:hypothetical protein